MEGVVRSWDAEEGWGVIDVPALDGPVWAHFSALDGEGFLALAVGDAVELEVIAVPGGQDGYAHRATRVARQG